MPNEKRARTQKIKIAYNKEFGISLHGIATEVRLIKQEAKGLIPTTP